ncbi:hypothetical protein AUC68_12780 [Methyloceanibacter methanicus]|uniref:Glycosyltransferase 2-like domain-containing protein n=1 Tax=Methyloceanibacter methanicus TaxID=1774968 RepID=A0A1E3W663_9HYPH|nr:glycosyltransferase [Methyloceanibacter methanicus]ODS01230.1 hypothetical protein AUC68_12780 [Methyloceanibacter methanicus]
MSIRELVEFLASAWRVGHLKAPLLLLRYLMLTMLNRTSRRRVIRHVPEIHAAEDVAVSATVQGITDIVVPVYGNFEQTRALLEALGNDPELPGRVVVIDDASPDPRVGPMLQAACADRADWQLIENEQNMGFVETCNRGFAASRRDVIVLNTDTEVPAGALWRIARALQAAPDIATATPFSNAAYGVGFPELNYPNPRPFGATTAEIDAAFAGLRLSTEIGLPRGVGFCMGMSRHAIERIGGFSTAFGRGYGEDSGFSLQAARLGLRNVVATNAYVFHVGGQSFGGGWQARSRRATLQILDRYPEYVKSVEDYLATGLARAVCFAAMLRLAESRSGAPVAIGEGAAADADQAVVTIGRTGPCAEATVTFRDESYGFSFGNQDALDRALALYRG